MHFNASDFINHVSSADTYQTCVKSGSGEYKQSTSTRKEIHNNKTEKSLYKPTLLSNFLLSPYFIRTPLSSPTVCQVFVTFLFYRNKIEEHREAEGKAWWLSTPLSFQASRGYRKWGKIITVTSLSKRKPCAATYLCCQVMPCCQVLEPEEAVPVSSSTPTWVMLDHLQEESQLTGVEELSVHTEMPPNWRHHKSHSLAVFSRWREWGGWVQHPSVQLCQASR